MTVSTIVHVGALELKNPVLSASGTYGHGLEMSNFVSPALLGGLVSKTVTRKPRPGNAPPRMAETPSGMLNSIGLENRGIEYYKKEVLPTLRGAGTRIITNIGGESVEDFAYCAELLDSESVVEALEVNLSCPNIQGAKLPFSTDANLAAAAIAAVRKATKKPVWAKLSPNVTSIGDIAKAVEAAGADAITAINTLLGMAIDWQKRLPLLSTTFGGLSGPAIKPVALRMVVECSRSVRIPIVAAGGARSADDVLEFLVAGASAVQIGTWNFVDPAAIGVIVNELPRLLRDSKIADIADLIGSLRAPTPVKFEGVEASLER
ncbi:MAG: dihydroorotate dehydrogenase [Planctomycetes bacterium]|nr:dihydroorotate dehydrogenase [Planctomycetota bacterium]